jgi:hypothetical protein
VAVSCFTADAVSDAESRVRRVCSSARLYEMYFAVPGGGGAARATRRRTAENGRSVTRAFMPSMLCHLGLGKLYRCTSKRTEAHESLTTATTMYREMGMWFWLEKAEAEMRELA